MDREQRLMRVDSLPADPVAGRVLSAATPAAGAASFAGLLQVPQAATAGMASVDAAPMQRKNGLSAESDHASPLVGLGLPGIDVAGPSTASPAAPKSAGLAVSANAAPRRAADVSVRDVGPQPASGAAPITSAGRESSQSAVADPRAPVVMTAQPTQAQPTQAQPTQAQPTQAQPTQAQPTQAQPTQAQPAQVQPAQVQTAQVQPTQVQPTQVQPTQVQTAQVQTAQVQAGQVPTPSAPTQALGAVQQPGAAIGAGDSFPAALSPADSTRAVQTAALHQVQRVAGHGAVTPTLQPAAPRDTAGEALWSTLSVQAPVQPTLAGAVATAAVAAAPVPVANAEQLAMQLQLQLRDGVQKATVRLHPESLGELQVAVETAEHQVRVVVAARQPEAVEWLQQSSSRLQAALDAAGFSDVDVDVRQDFGDQPQSDPDHNTAQGAHRASSLAGDEKPTRPTHAGRATAGSGQAEGLDTWA